MLIGQAWLILLHLAEGVGQRGQRGKAELRLIYCQCSSQPPPPLSLSLCVTHTHTHT